MIRSFRVPSRVLMAGLLAVFSTCPTLVTIRESCGTGTNSGICVGQMRVPQEHANKFVEGSRLAIDIIHSEEFAARVQQYMDGALRNPQYATGDWNGLTASGIVGGLRRTLPGLQVATYGAPWHYLSFKFSGNVAVDGGGSGPIEINRWALPGWDGIDVGASITHEASHRAGMTHYKDRKECGPPYVLHTIMEQIARGNSWKWDEANYCESFRPASQGASEPA